jgi:hypothetical protein
MDPDMPKGKGNLLKGKGPLKGKGTFEKGNIIVWAFLKRKGR